MRRLIALTTELIFLVLCLVAVFSPLCALADDGYEWVRITDDGVFLYANNYSSKVLCILHKSYYLRVISRGEDMLQVSVPTGTAAFPTIVGYVWASQVKTVKTTPLAPYYPTETLTVIADSAPVLLSPVPSAETLLVAANTQQMSFYGEVISYGATWYYVYCGGKFGYVRCDCVTSPQIQPHPTPLEEAKPTVNPNPSEDDETPPADLPATSGAEILLIVFVVVFALGIALAIVLPGNVKRKGNDLFDKDI